MYVPQEQRILKKLAKFLESKQGLRLPLLARLHAVDNNGQSIGTQPRNINRHETIQILAKLCTTRYNK